jgi:LPS export ABC transporter ATP-binding protein
VTLIALSSPDAWGKPLKSDLRLPRVKKNEDAIKDYFRAVSAELRVRFGKIRSANTDPDVKGHQNEVIVGNFLQGMYRTIAENSIFRDLSVEDNLGCILETLGISRKESRQRRDALIDEYGLTQVRKSIARVLSGGEKRRLEIARALITQPRLMLLDEPFAGIDPIAVGDIQKIVFGLRDRGISVFITDHNVRETLATTDRLYLMSDGRVLVSGTPREIVANPDARRLYLGEGFQLDLPAAPGAPVAPESKPAPVAGEEEAA